MDITLRRKIKYFRYLLALILVSFMVFVSEFLNCKEIIFPEILALLTSTWVVSKTPWKTSKKNIFILMSISAFFGVLVARYINSFVIVQVLICLLFSSFLLIKFKTNLLPLISASILPIYLKTTTFIYPISVSLLSLITVLGIYFLEKSPLKAKHFSSDCPYKLNKECKYWLKIVFLLTIITFVPYGTNNLFYIAPPLIVTFVEFSKSKNKSYFRAKKVIFLLFVASLLGVFFKLLLVNFPYFPSTLAVIFASLILFIIYEKIGMIFHPAGAILLIPFLLDNNFIINYPIQVLIGSVVIVLAAKHLFK